MSEIILSLDPNKRSVQTVDFQTALRAKIVGQAEGVQALVDLYQVFCAGLNSPGRPVGNLLFLGPTGSGKTRMVEAAARSQVKCRLRSIPLWRRRSRHSPSWTIRSIAAAIALTS